jgi:hypothetical protein
MNYAGHAKQPVGSLSIRPIIPNVPFDLPNSIRPLEVTAPVGAPLRWVPGINVDPTNQPVTINNQLVNSAGSTCGIATCSATKRTS